MLSKKLTKCQVFICKILEDVIEPSNMFIAAAKLRTQELSSPKQTSGTPFDWLSYKYKKKHHLCRMLSFVTGGAREDRTPDLMIANHSLSQLSYDPDGYNMKKAPPKTMLSF